MNRYANKNKVILLGISRKPYRTAQKQLNWLLSDKHLFYVSMCDMRIWMLYRYAG